MGLFGKKKKEKQQWQDAVLTLYACYGYIDQIPNRIQEVFLPVTERFTQVEQNHYEILLKDNTTMDFFLTTDPEETVAQAMGMAKFFSQATLENQAVKEAALMQIMAFNCIVGIGFQVDNDSMRKQALVDTAFDLAKVLSGFVLTPNMSLFYFDGRLLISIEGETSFDTFYPIADAAVLDKDRGEPEQVDEDRRTRSIAACREKNIPYIEHLRAAVYERECRIPAKEEIIHRLTAIFATCVRSEVFTSGHYQEPEKMAQEMAEDLDKRYGIKEWLSDKERAYLEGKIDGENSHGQFDWRYECCAVLLWALSLLEIGEPDHICDASQIGSILWKNDFGSLMEKALLRSQTELLDMQDLIFRYDWACVDARIHEKEMTVINGEVVYEWHYALNWLVGADKITDWDKVKTTT